LVSRDAIIDVTFGAAHQELKSVAACDIDVFCDLDSRSRRGRDIMPQPATSALHDKIYALIELGYDATAAYTAAVRKLNNIELRVMLDEFRCDHMRHTYVLSRQLRDLGKAPPSGFDIRPLLASGPKVVRELTSDEQVLEAMEENERVTFRAYSNALLDAGLGMNLAKTLRQNLDDEYRHGTWIRRELARLNGAHASESISRSTMSDVPPMPASERRLKANALTEQGCVTGNPGLRACASHSAEDTRATRDSGVFAEQRASSCALPKAAT
jgi:rubrerythrin